MPQCRRASPSAPLGERQNAPRQPRRQHRAHLLDAGLQEFGRPYTGSPGLAPTLGGDASHARRIDLGLRDADHVLVGHAHRQVPRGLAQQPALRPWRARRRRGSARAGRDRAARRPRPDRRRAGARLRRRCRARPPAWLAIAGCRAAGTGRPAGALRPRHRQPARGVGLPRRLEAGAEAAQVAVDAPCRRRGSRPRTPRPGSAAGRSRR